jgi:hypothetical protein
MPGEEPMEVTAVPIGPIHHWGDGQAPWAEGWSIEEMLHVQKGE